jgi:hypothetical protein
MRLKGWLQVALTFQLLSATSCSANPITYTAPTNDQPGKFVGSAPLARVNRLLLPDGLAEFAGDELRVGAVPDWLFDREIVLKGPIIRAEVVKQPAATTVAGLVYFLDGSWLPNLGRTVAPDVITLKNGEVVRGHIPGRTGDAFVVQTVEGQSRKVSFGDIATISSPRAFAFNIPVTGQPAGSNLTSLTFESSNMTMLPTLGGPLLASRKATVPVSTLPGAEVGISNTAIATFVALDILISDIAPAVSIPLTLNKSNTQAALNEIKKVDMQNGMPDN